MRTCSKYPILRSLACLWISVPFLFPVSTALASGLPSVGIELEYAASDALEANGTKIEPAKYKAPLEKLREIYKGLGLTSQSDIKMSRWHKNSDGGKLKMATLVDPLGREWTVEPEVINAKDGHDGFEVVTPPLSSTQDLKVFHQLVESIDRGRKYVKGLKSSAHFTLDARHLIAGTGASANVSKLVDTILFIENHWPEIYSAISPNRMGTIANRFGPPIAAQPELKGLLKKLAALPKSERTYGKVKAIFKAYHDREVELQGVEEHAWKYRAANYGKIFGLGENAHIPVIEFRIGDLQDADTLSKHATFLRTVVGNASELEPNQHEFKDPFKGAEIEYEHEWTPDEKLHFEAINQRIHDFPERDYHSFLGRLGFTPQQFPKLEFVKGVPTMGYLKSELDAMLETIDITEPITQGGKKVTFGFEAEADEKAARKVAQNSFWKFWDWKVTNDQVDSEDPWYKQAWDWISGTQIETPTKTRTDEFPFLEPDPDREEETGNIEVRSKPTARLSTALQQMKKVKKSLGKSLKGFHIHMRIPADMWKQIPKEDLEGWVSRLADTGMAWRLKHRRSWYALDSATHSRLYPDAISDRGAVRALTDKSVDEYEEEERPKHLGGALDIELRGFMDDIDAIERFAKIVLLGFQNPEMIRGFKKAQVDLTENRQSLPDVIDAFAQKYHGHKLSREQRKFLKGLEYSVGAYNDGEPIYNQEWIYEHTSNLPLYAFEKAPYLTELEARKVKDATFTFHKNVYNLMNGWWEDDPNYIETDAETQYATRIKIWEDEADFHRLLERSLLLDPERVKANSRKAKAASASVPIPSDGVASRAIKVATRKPFDPENAVPEKKTRRAAGMRSATELPTPKAGPVAKVAPKTSSDRELEKQVRGDESPTVVNRALVALAERGTPAAKRSIRFALILDPDAPESVEHTAARLMVDRGSKEKPALFSEEEALPLLARALEAVENAKPLIEILNGLSKFSNPKAAGLIFDRLQDLTELSSVRKIAAKNLVSSIGHLSSKQVTELLKMTSDKKLGEEETTALRQAVSAEITRRAEKAPATLLKEAIAHSDSEVRKAAAVALTVQKSTTALPVIAKALDHADPVVSHFAKRALLGRKEPVALALRRERKISKASCEREALSLLGREL